MVNKRENKEKTKMEPNKASKNNFFSRFSVFFKKRKYYIIGGMVVLIIVGIILARTISSRNDIASEYQTAVLNRSDLIAIVGATGIVEPNQTIELSWETTGRVKSVNVDVNDVVEMGDVLAELAENTLPQSVILANADLVTAKRELEDLVHSNTDSALAYTELLEAEEDFRVAEDEKEDWNYNEADEEKIDLARSEFLSAEEDYKAAKAAFDALGEVEDTDPEKVSAKEFMDEEKAKRDKAFRSLNYILGKVFDQEVAEDFADYDVALAKLGDAQREWERLMDGPNADDITAAEAKVAAAEATVSLGWIEAPFGGTVTRVDPKIGDEVDSGSSAFRIDDLSMLFVEVEISEVDVNRIELGQKADITFDAIIGETFTGEVLEVSSVGIDDGSGVDFQVTLEIIDPTDQVRPGMTAAVNIIVSEIKDVLSVPNRAVRLKGEQRVVYVIKNGEIQEVEIEFGASSDVYSEVKAGDIKEGDLIVLNPPMEFASNGGPPPFMRQ